MLKSLPQFAHLDETDASQLERQSTVLDLAPGDVLFRQDDLGDDALYVVLDGRLELRIDHPGGPSHVLGEVVPGDCVGEMALLTRDKRTATVTSLTSSRVLRVPIAACEAAMDASPETKDRLVDLALERLPNHYLTVHPLPGASEDALAELKRSATWVQLQAGETLFQQGDTPEAAYLVAHGRLDVSVDGHVVSAAGPGEFVGELALLLRQPRSATVRARRDSELVHISKQAFERALATDPSLAIELARQVGQRLMHAQQEATSGRTVRVVAVLALDATPESELFGRELAEALGGVLVGPDMLQAAQGISQLGDNELADMRLRRWLHEREQSHPHVVYAVSREPSAWSQLALRQADLVLIVSSGGSDHPSRLDQFSTGGLHAPVELVLLHSPGADLRAARALADFRDVRVGAVHHVRAASHAGDLRRLARSVQGSSVGLVLSGGGARGLAHVGVIRALAEAGVPIDHVGGTSFGAILGALCAQGRGASEIMSVCRRYYAEGTGFDLTLPVVALRSGRQTIRTLRALFGDTEIEELPTPFFCVSTDMTRAEVVVHDAGPIWLAVRASCAVPGLVPPVPYRGALLVDGGLLNNLPTDIMRDRSDGYVIAVDVSPKVDPTLTADGPAQVSGWQQLWARMTGARDHRFPSIAEVLSRAVLAASVRDSQAMGARADLYLHPPVDSVPMSAFKSIDDIVELGYRHASEQLESWLGQDHPLRGAITR